LELVDIPEDEVQWRFETSGGPGGQHANRSATRVVARWDATQSKVIDTVTRDRIVAARGGPVLSVTVDETRSQWRNRQIAMERLGRMLELALAPAPPPRKATKPSKGVQKRRLEAKKQRSKTKDLRRTPGEDD